MENKKEMYIWIAFIGIVGLFILLLPTIDDYVSGRRKLRETTTSTNTNKNNDTNKQNEQTKDVITEISCSLPEEDTDIEKITKSVKFTTKNDKLATINTTKLYKYEDGDDYQFAKEDIETATDLKGTGYEITSTFDDPNFAYTIQINIDYGTFVITTTTNNSILESEISYPKTRTDLESYLSSNGYTCSKKAS